MTGQLLPGNSCDMGAPSLPASQLLLPLWNCPLLLTDNVNLEGEVVGQTFPALVTLDEVLARGTVLDERSGAAEVVDVRLLAEHKLHHPVTGAQVGQQRLKGLEPAPTGSGLVFP